MDASPKLAARYNVRALLPGPEAALRDAVQHLGASVTHLQALARYGAVEALAIEGLRADQTRVLERVVRDGGGQVLSSLNGDRVVVLCPLLIAGQLPARLAEWSDTAAEVGEVIAAALMARGIRPAPVSAGGRELRFDRRTLVMGVLNLTPDSFSGDGVGDDVARAVDRAQQMEAEGADLIDVGGESTRPGSTPVDEREELRRLMPALRALRDVLRVPISVDTRKPAVARQALDEGAAMLNDVWGLRADPSMAAVVAEHPGCAVVLMHNQQGTDYQDLLADVTRELRRGVAIAADSGIAPERTICDPGFGFGKTPAQNLELLRRLGELRSLARPVLVGLSRKHTIGLLLDGAPPSERVEGSIAMAVLAVAGGAHMVRVHDVGATVRALRVADAVVRGTPAAVTQMPAPGPTG